MCQFDRLVHLALEKVDVFTKRTHELKTSLRWQPGQWHWNTSYNQQLPKFHTDRQQFGIHLFHLSR